MRRDRTLHSLTLWVLICGFFGPVPRRCVEWCIEIVSRPLTVDTTPKEETRRGSEPVAREAITASGSGGAIVRPGTGEVRIEGFAPEVLVS
jgi:hypothetical protein